MLCRAALRALPKAGPRLAQRTCHIAARHGVRLEIRPLVRQQTARLQSISRSAFSTSARRSDEVSEELSAKLTNEIALEEENTDAQADSDANVRKFLQENDQWALEAPEGQQDVVLRRQYDDETITVGFSIVDFNTTAMPLDGEEPDESYLDEEEEIAREQSGGANSKGAINQGGINQGGTKNANFKVAPEDSIAPADQEDMMSEDEYDDAQQAFPANVNVLVQRAGKGALRFNLVADNGRFSIHGVTHLPESSTASPSELLRDTPDHLYTGPPFQQLDEEVQGMFESYLDARGINTALAVFIPDYIDVKEQKEYLAWLGRVKSFVD